MPAESTARTLAPLALALAMLAPCDAAAAQQGHFIADGIEVAIKPPTRWTYLGRVGDRGALRAMYCAPRFFTPKAGDRGQHTPSLRLMWLDAKAAGAEDATAKKSEWPMRTPYTNVRDYIDRSHGLLKPTINNVEEGTFDERKGVTYEVQYAREFGDLTLYLTSIKMDGGELLIEFELITEQFKRQRGSFVKSLSTLKFVPKDQLQPLPKVETPPWTKDLADWLKKPKQERAKYRTDWSQKWMAAESAVFQPGWKIVKNKYFLVMTRADAKYTKRIVQAAEVAYEWAQSKFDGISDDVVMPAILRIFDSSREEVSYRDRDRDVNPTVYEGSTREIFAFKDASLGNLGDGFGGVIRGVARHYIHDKHPLINLNMPRWFEGALYGITDGTRVVGGKKLAFYPNDLETKRWALNQQRGEEQKVFWYTHKFRVETPKDGTPDKFEEYWMECTRVLRWIEEGGGKVLKQDDFIGTYLAAVGKLAMTFRPRPELGVDLGKLDDEKRKALHKLTQARRDEFLQKVNWEVMPIADQQWDPINKAFQAWNEEYSKRKFKKK